MRAKLKKLNRDFQPYLDLKLKFRQYNFLLNPNYH